MKGQASLRTLNTPFIWPINAEPHRLFEEEEVCDSLCLQELQELEEEKLVLQGRVGGGPGSSSIQKIYTGFSSLYPNAGGTCINPCPAGYRGDTSINQCIACYTTINGVSPYSCEYCTSSASNACTSCYAGTFLYGGQCLDPCPNGYYGDTNTNTCKSCYSSGSSPYTCPTCTGPSSDECLTCNSGTYLYEGQCLASCPTGYWPSTSAPYANTCQPCYVSSGPSPFSCRTCNAGASSNCLSCNANTYLYPSTSEQCVDPCPNGYWGDTTTWTCQPCYNPSGSPTQKACATCFGPTSFSCITCPAGTYFFSVDNSCLSTCPTGYYVNGNLCSKCYQNNPPSYPDGTCLTCSEPNSNQCQSCGSLQYLDSTTGKCVNTCPIGWYADPITNTCNHCYQASSSSSTYQNCYTCLGGAYTDCTACLSGTYLDQETQTCLHTCPAGWWADLPTLTCKICYQYTASNPTVFTCATCNASNYYNCLSCSSPYFLDSTTNTCVQTCPAGYWGDNSSNTCQPCYSTGSSTAACKTCSGGSNTQCTSCNSGTYLYTSGTSNTCITTCPNGWYPDSSSLTCNLCFQSSSSTAIPNTCATCTGPNSDQCVSCLSTAYWDPLTSSCINPCSAGYYADTTTHQCKQCFQAASSTSSPQSCQTCSGGLSTNCISCNSGQYLLPSTSSCLSSCPSGTYARTDINWCGNCYQAPSAKVIERSCATCNGWKSTNCLTCPSKTYFNPQNNTCLNTCPPNTYYDTNSQSCQQCYQTDSIYFGCATCTGPMYSQCTSCAEGLYFFAQNNSCGNTCPCGGGYYYNVTTDQCGTCYSGCEFCTSPNAQDCYYPDTYDYNCLLGDFDGKNQTQKIAMSVQIAGNSAFLLSLAAVLLSGASTMGASIVFTYFGLLGLYQFLNVDYGSNALVFFQIFFSFNGALDFPNFFLSSDTKYWNSDTIIEGNNKFNLFRISYLFLKNFGGRLSLLLLLFASVPILVVIPVLLENIGAKEKYQKIFNAVKTFIQWNLIISVFLASFVPMTLSFCLQFHFLDRPKVWYDIFSSSVCLLVTIVAAGLTIALYLYTRIRNLNSTSHPNLSRSTKILANQEDIDSTKDLDPKSKNKYWALASCIRNLFLVTFVANLSNYPLVQCSTALATNIAFFLGILKWKFFDRKIKNVIIRVCEGLNAVIPSLFLIHAIYEYLGVTMPQQTKMDIGWAIIALVSTVTVLALIYQVVEILYLIKRIGSPFFNKLKAFLDYSIGRDIWQRQPKQPFSSSKELTQLKSSSVSLTQPKSQEYKNRRYKTGDHSPINETSDSFFKRSSLSPVRIESSRIDLAKNHDDIMTLKKPSPVEDIISMWIKK